MELKLNVCTHTHIHTLQYFLLLYLLLMVQIVDEPNIWFSRLIDFILQICRKISAHEFERGGLLKPIVNTIDGTPTFLSVNQNESSSGSNTNLASNSHSHRPQRLSRNELKHLDEKQLIFELVRYRMLFDSMFLFFIILIENFFYDFCCYCCGYSFELIPPHIIKHPPYERKRNDHLALTHNVYMVHTFSLPHSHFSFSLRFKNYLMIDRVFYW